AMLPGLLLKLKRKKRFWLVAFCAKIGNARWMVPSCLNVVGAATTSSALTSEVSTSALRDPALHIEPPVPGTAYVGYRCHSRRLDGYVGGTRFRLSVQMDRNARYGTSLARVAHFQAFRPSGTNGTIGVASM